MTGSPNEQIWSTKPGVNCEYIIGGKWDFNVVHDWDADPTRTGWTVLKATIAYTKTSCQRLETWNIQGPSPKGVSDEFPPYTKTNVDVNSAPQITSSPLLSNLQG